MQSDRQRVYSREARSRNGNNRPGDVGLHDHRSVGCETDRTNATPERTRAQLAVLLTQARCQILAPCKRLPVGSKGACSHQGSHVTISASERARMLCCRPENRADGKVNVPFTRTCAPSVPLSRSNIAAAAGSDFAM